MNSLLIILGLGLCCTGSRVLCAEAGPPDDQRRTGYVQDTSTNPFILTGVGKEPSDPFPVCWDGVWHLYSMSKDYGRVLHFTSTDLVKWVEHKPAMVGGGIATGSVVRHDNKYSLFYTDAGPQTIRLVVSDNPWEFDFSKSRLVAEADGKTYRKGWFPEAYVFYNEEEKLWWMLGGEPLPGSMCRAVQVERPARMDTERANRQKHGSG